MIPHQYPVLYRQKCEPSGRSRGRIVILDTNNRASTPPWTTLANVRLREWSGRWESNPRLKLGKLGYYHYTTPARAAILVAFGGIKQIHPTDSGKAPRTDTLSSNFATSEQCPLALLFASALSA